MRQKVDHLCLQLFTQGLSYLDAGAHVRLVGFVWIRKYPDIMSAFDQPRDVEFASLGCLLS